ncbi:ATP-binding cassette domain-containing protein [Legionella nagasakiensis]|uniref:ATP-binding cassette domain-containing protein n=1 Tax=Legionella nagasakiensis TaxID=535290 RepID=UPI001056411B
MLQIIDASKQFDRTLVLNRLNLVIAANSIVGLAGPSGSGKSTLLRCIQQLESLDSGAIQFTGKSGFMFQDFQLFPHMTVLKNLMYAPTLHDKNHNHREKAIDLLTTLGLKDKAHLYPQQLSGGQKQRVALARSLMMQPDLLLCDEPTSGLDMASIGGVVSLLKTVKSMQVTMIIASHDLKFLTQIADRIILLKEGSLTTDIQPAALTDPVAYLKPYYQEAPYETEH